MHDLVDKKVEYKKIARGFKGDYENLITKERDQFEQVKQDMQQVIEE